MALFTTILGSAFLAGVANAVVNAAIAYALSALAQTFVKRPKQDTSALDFSQTVQRRLSIGQPLEVLVGRRIVGGVGFFDDSFGYKRERGVSISVVSCKPCTQFHTLFLDGEPVTLSGDPTQGEVWVTSHFLGRPAKVATSTFGGIALTLVEGDLLPRVRVRITMGQNNNSFGAYLGGKFPGKFTNTDNFGDYCVVVLDCRNTNDDFDEEEGKSYIPFQGYPEYKVEMSGVEVCDPRNGGVYGNEATYVYSNNSALVDAQFDFGWYSGDAGPGRALAVGNGYDTELMDLTQIGLNADYCDAENFTCAGLLRSGQPEDQEEVWKTYNADRVENAAAIYSIPEGARGPAELLDMSQHLGAWVGSYDEQGLSTEVYNEVRTVYSEPVEYYGEKDLAILTNPDWIADDNHIPRQMSLPLLFVTDSTAASKLAKQEVNISRAPATCVINDLPMGYRRLRVGSLIELSGSDIPAANNRLWIIKGRGQSVRGDVSLSLREYAGDSAFIYDPQTDFLSPEVTAPVLRPWSEWNTVIDYVPSSVVVDVNGIIDGTRPIADVLIEGQGSLAASGAVLGETNTPVDPAVLNVVINVSQVSASGSDAGNYTTEFARATVSGGTVPYSGSWSKVSGDPTDRITPNTPSSVNTIFIADLVEDDSVSGVWRYTSTDSSDPVQTASDDVAVSFFTFTPPPQGDPDVPPEQGDPGGEIP